MSMGEMFNGSGGYSLSGGSSEAGGNDKVGGGYSGISFGVLPPLPSMPTMNATLPSLPSLPTYGGGAQQANVVTWLAIGLVAAGGVYLVMKRGK